MPVQGKAAGAEKERPAPLLVAKAHWVSGSGLCAALCWGHAALEFWVDRRMGGGDKEEGRG